ncbi:MAG TPA: hypothetical protein V6C64_06250, partial [Microcoleaceae cyanobacterium]
MDWTTPLRSQQVDFIKRLKSDSANLHRLTDPNLRGCHSELVAISGKELEEIDRFCWEMVDSYGKKPSSKSRDIYINNMKGKLGELAIERYLDKLITPIDLEKKPGGDGGIDFKLLSNPETCIQVKARHGKVDNTYWSISRNEIEKNTVLVCVFIQEDIGQRQHEYN